MTRAENLKKKKKRVEDLEKLQTETERRQSIEEQQRRDRENASLVTQYSVLQKKLGGSMMDSDTYSKGYGSILKYRRGGALTPEERQQAEDFLGGKKAQETAADKIVSEGYAAAQVQATTGKLNSTQKQQLDAFQTLMQTIDGHGQNHIEIAKKTVGVLQNQAREIAYVHDQLLGIQKLLGQTASKIGR
jgi:hypothetical protein